jgi:hypothetical protein
MENNIIKKTPIMDFSRKIKNLRKDLIAEVTKLNITFDKIAPSIEVDGDSFEVESIENGYVYFHNPWIDDPNDYLEISKLSIEELEEILKIAKK